MTKIERNPTGNWAFVIGIILSFIMAAGTAASVSWAKSNVLYAVLVSFGVVIGLVNITKKEMAPFLIAAIALVVMSVANLAVFDSIIPAVGSFFNAWIDNIVSFVAPAALIVALKEVYLLASEA